MLPLPDSLLERSFNSQLELDSPASSPNPITHPINFFSYPNPTLILEGFQLPHPDQLLNDPINNSIFDPTQRNNTDQNPNSRGKRSGRKDRHSKIHTAMGLRDRRMRLSREVAHKFFGLQDMLGFDKASKTVQWLLSKSKSAIKEVGGASKGVHSNEESASPNNGDWPTSDCEDASTVSDNNKLKNASYEKKSKVKKTNIKAPRKNNAHQTPDKESRAKARERARERTKEKHRLHWENLASSIAPKGIGVEESSSYGYTNYSSNLINEVEEGSSSSVNRYNFTIGSEPREIPVFNYVGYENGGFNNTICTYQEQWDIEAAFFGAMQYHSTPYGST